MDKHNLHKSSQELLNQPKSNFSIFLVVIILFLMFFSGVVGFFFGKRENCQSEYKKESKNIPTPLIKTESKDESFSLKIPEEEDWIQYQANCDNLADNIVIYYPKGWFPKEFPNVTDSYHEGSEYECQVIFGYGAQPESYQNKSEGVVTEIRVATWVDKTKTLEQLAQERLNMPYSSVKSVSEITLNGQLYVKEMLGDEDYWLLTKKGDRFFEIHLPDKHTFVYSTGTGEESVTSNLILDKSREVIIEEFIKRIKIL